MPLKSTIVLCDTCVVLEAFRVRAWDALIAKFNVLVSETIIKETVWYKDSQGHKKVIDLGPYIKSGKIQSFDVSIEDLKSFAAKYNPVYRERLDAGELSLLCYLFLYGDDKVLICSGDAIVFKILGKDRKSSQGISLEELLTEIGHTKPILHQFRKEFKERNSREGFSDSFS